MAEPFDQTSRAESPPFRLLRYLGLAYEMPEHREGRSCVLLQIDGLSHAEFIKAVKDGQLPFIAKLLASDRAVAVPWRSMLPASTGAFQSGLFYGDNHDVPGFFWYDKERHTEIHLNAVDDVAGIEDALSKRVSPFRGLLDRGAAYTAIFTGGARDTLLTFSRLFRPSLNVGTRPRWILLFVVSQFVLLARLVYYASVEVVVALFDLVYGLFSQHNKFLEFQFLFPRIACVVLCREIATLAAILDIRRGVGPIYVNYLGYDEHAHHRGPNSAFAQWTLKGLDASVHRVYDAIQRAEHDGVRQYDLYVWSDHGQVPSVPFQERFGQEPARHFELLFDILHGETDDVRKDARTQRDQERLGRGRLIKGQRGRRDLSRIKRQAGYAHEVRELLPGPLRRLYDRLLRAAQEAYAHDGREIGSPESPRLKFVSTGPVAGLYLEGVTGPVDFEVWGGRFPEFLEELARHEGIGFSLIRTRNGGAKVGAAGMWFEIDDADAMATAGLPELSELLRGNRDGLCRWANMPSAGDILIFGHRSRTGPVITYSYERGAHAGPSRPELTPFIVVPRRAAPIWPEVFDSDGERLTLRSLHERLRDNYYHSDDGEAADG